MDAHTHILPKAWPDLAMRYGDPRWPKLEHIDACSAHITVGGDVFRRVTNQCYDIARRLADMDATGVAIQVLSTVPVMFSYWAEPERCREMSRYLNEHLASVVCDNPDRFLALGTVPLNDPDMAVEEMERCMGEWGMAGIEIGTNIGGLDLDDPRFESFFGRAAELDAIIFVHPWQVVGGNRLRNYYFLYTVGMPAETSYAVGALVFGGVLERIPGLKVLFAHGGGSVPYIIGRMQRGWDVWEPARARADRAPIEQLRDCYFDSVTWDEASLELLVRRVGAEHVLLGSDYPFIMGEDRPGAMLEQSAITSAERELVGGGSARRLFGIRDAVDSGNA